MSGRSQGQPSLKLRQLLGAYLDDGLVENRRQSPLAEDQLVTGLALDSRKLEPGNLFVALQGQSTDGVNFIADAVARGAVAVLVDAERAAQVPEQDVPVLPVRQLSARLGEIAADFYGRPSNTMRLVGVTGTNGKTSCCHFIAQSMGRLGRRAAVIGTLGYGVPGSLKDVGHTTPDAISVQRMLAELRGEGTELVAMEVSSHGLDQRRVSGVCFDTAVFTNLSRDHLDYHGTMERYAAAKRELFLLPELKQAVINFDDAYGKQLTTQLPPGLKLCRYGLANHSAEVSVGKVEISAEGLRATVHTPWGDGILVSALLGRFNLSNLLAVLSVLCLQGVELAAALSAIAKLTEVPGRMQCFGGNGLPLVVVDYAHTPDALQLALQTLKELPHRRLWCVFGCGGDRDRGKRGQMGSIAVRFAQHVVLTNDNPRREPEHAIIDDILTGILVRTNVSIELDRAAAIRSAIVVADAEDIILVAGKGHENYQQFSDARTAFSDIEQVKQGLLARQRQGAGARGVES